MSDLNYYGLPVTPPEYFGGEHVANPMGAGLPPVCSCGWTRWEYAPGKWFEISDHLRDMGVKPRPKRYRYRQDHLYGPSYREEIK